jgi:aerobic carbon-monoxide dehydrogenase large subunit
LLSTQPVIAQETAREKRLVGAPIKRIEDPKFLSGRARYIADVQLPGMLTASFVRSPHAHAKVVAVDARAALKVHGVVAVLTGSDIRGTIGNMPVDVGESEGEDSEELRRSRTTPRPALAQVEVNYAGEAVAMVLGEDAYVAEDGAEAVVVEYEPLEAVVDVEVALAKGSPRVHDYLPDNIADRKTREDPKVKKAFEEADEILKIELVNQRISPVSIEPRGIVASYDPGSDSLLVWASVQSPQETREGLARVLGIPTNKVRVIAPDMGGAFGSKGDLYPEDVMVCYAAMKLDRPVRWIEGRRENLMATKQGRGQRQYAEFAVRRDGRILGMKTRLIADGGAYNTGSSVGVPSGTYVMGTGVYDIPAYSSDRISVFTNKVPRGAYRGAGRPEATYLIERSMNVIAQKLKLDPVKMRLKNFIPKDSFPYTNAAGTTYDSGDYESNMLRALEVSNYAALRREQSEARRDGRLVGIGISTYVEIGGFSPGFGQTASITVTSEGEVLVAAGGMSHGQAHATTFSQVVADALGIDMSRISFAQGDTGVLPWSSATGGSRSGPVTGSAVLLCAMKVRAKMTRIAAHMLGHERGATTSFVFSGGRIYAEGESAKALDFAAVARTAYRPLALPPGMEPTLYEYAAYTPKSNVFPFGTHIAVVEVDKETGVVSVKKYFAVDDCANVINPLVVEGQLQGGIVQGISQAMLEQVVFDSNGQPLSTTLADYAISSADSTPPMVCDRTITPTDANLLGIKGVGEAGATAATPAIVNAVEDALSPYDVVIEGMPLRADYIKSLIDGNPIEVKT